MTRHQRVWPAAMSARQQIYRPISSASVLLRVCCAAPACQPRAAAQRLHKVRQRLDAVFQASHHQLQLTQLSSCSRPNRRRQRSQHCSWRSSNVCSVHGSMLQATGPLAGTAAAACFRRGTGRCQQPVRQPCANQQCQRQRSCKCRGIQPLVATAATAAAAEAGCASSSSFRVWQCPYKPYWLPK
jgi:hypothetical protein